jgi:hypothetical protein
MLEDVQNMLSRAASQIINQIADFLPGLRGLSFDERAEQFGLGALADSSSLGSPSMLLARIVMWVVMFAGLLVSLSALDAALPEEFARRVFSYMPDVVAALLILVFGSGLARFLARSVLIGAVNLQMPQARLLSLGVKWLVLVLAWTMALEHLRIGRQILPLAFGILFGGIVLTLALAIGLGSKDLVKASLERQGRPADPADKLPHV